MSVVAEITATNVDSVERDLERWMRGRVGLTEADVPYWISSGRQIDTVTCDVTDCDIPGGGRLQIGEGSSIVDATYHREDLAIIGGLAIATYSIELEG